MSKQCVPLTHALSACIRTVENTVPTGTEVEVWFTRKQQARPQIKVISFTGVGVTIDAMLQYL